MNAESVGKGQDFGFAGVQLPICSPSSIDRSPLRGLWLDAGKQSV